MGQEGVHATVDMRTTCGFSPSKRWVPETELKSSSLAGVHSPA